MKVGDLVELSSKGRETLWCKEFRDMVGVVTEITVEWTGWKYYTVMFTGRQGTRQQTKIPRSYLKIA